MVQEAEEQLTLAKHSVESCSQGISNLTQIISRLIGKFLTLDTAPQRLNRVQIGSISGQPLDSKPERRPLGNPAFVLKYEPAPYRSAFFFSSGHV
jgi:hypothetical protein